jgi:hypothetical protein
VAKQRYAHSALRIQVDVWDGLGLQLIHKHNLLYIHRKIKKKKKKVKHTKYTNKSIYTHTTAPTTPLVLVVSSFVVFLLDIK